MKSSKLFDLSKTIGELQLNLVPMTIYYDAARYEYMHHLIKTIYGEYATDVWQWMKEKSMTSLHDLNYWYHVVISGEIKLSEIPISEKGWNQRRRNVQELIKRLEEAAK